MPTVIIREILESYFPFCESSSIPDQILYSPRDCTIAQALKRIRADETDFSRKILFNLVTNTAIVLLKAAFFRVHHLIVAERNGVNDGDTAIKTGDQLRIQVEMVESFEAQYFYLTAKVTNQNNKLIKLIDIEAY